MTKVSTQNSDRRAENLRFTDTHCHIHEESYAEQEAAYRRAMDVGVQRLICVGTDEKSSREAVEFARTHENTWASVGLHPHDATSGVEAISDLEEILVIQSEPSLPLSASDSFGANYDSVLPHSAGKAESSANNGYEDSAHADRKIVAIGEIGLDYFYDNSPREQQIEMLHAQLELAQKYDVPVIFHVRDAKEPSTGSVWHDFWPIFDSYEGLRGVLHSFTDNLSNLEKGLSRGLLVGVNGISTFTHDEKQREMYRSIPVDRLLLETDAPFLTPVPRRGTVNEPAFITHIAHHIANLRSISLEELSRATERNATDIFFSNK